MWNIFLFSYTVDVTLSSKPNIPFICIFLIHVGRLDILQAAEVMTLNTLWCTDCSSKFSNICLVNFVLFIPLCDTWICYSTVLYILSGWKFVLICIHCIMIIVTEDTLMYGTLHCTFCVGAVPQFTASMDRNLWCKRVLSLLNKLLYVYILLLLHVANYRDRNVWDTVGLVIHWRSFDPSPTA